MESSEIKCMNNDGKKVFYELFRQNIGLKAHKSRAHLIRLNFTIALNALYPWFSKALLCNR